MSMGIPPAKKPRLLFLSQGFPYPPDGGGYIKTFNTLTALAKKYEIWAVFVSEKPAVKEGLAYFQNIGVRCVVVDNPNVYRPVKQNLRWLFSNLLQGIPHYVFQYTQPLARQKIQELWDTIDPDLVHVDHLNLAQYLPKQKKIPWILEHHNLEFFLYWTRFKYTRRLDRKLYILLEMLLTFGVEWRWLPKFDVIWCISKEEKLRLLKFFPHVKGFVKAQPLVYPIPTARSRQVDSTSILFIGNTQWPPNEDALEWFISSIWPLIAEAEPAARLEVVGRKFPGLVNRLPIDHRIKFHDYQPDLAPYLARASVFILPFRMGGGVRIKSLTALASGLPVVSTPLGVEGLQVKHRRECMIASEKEEFAKQVVALLHSRTSRERLSKAAQLYYETHHGLDQNRRYVAEYQQVIQLLLRHKTHG